MTRQAVMAEAENPSLKKRKKEALALIYSVSVQTLSQTDV